MPPMTSLESLVKSVRAALGQFCHTSKKLAAPILEPFGHSSEQCSTVDEGEIGRLKLRLEKIRDLLKQADHDFTVSDLSVKLWLKDLRDLEYCLEDVIEEIEFEMLRATTLAEFSAELMSCTNRKRKHEVSFLCFPSPSCLGRKIQRIWDKYHEIAFDREALRLDEGDGERRPSISPLQPSSSYPTSPILHGRKSDMEQVIEMIRFDNHDTGCNYSVIPIYGMAGVGKTTFVQHLYHRIADKFDLNIWVWLFQDCNAQQITFKIGKAISNFIDPTTGLDELHNIIKEKFMEKRFLLVLDNVWIEDQASWELLKVPLSFGAKGSKVVVTTRSKVVAKMTCPKPYHLRCLSDDDCLSVCTQKLISHNCDIPKDSNSLDFGTKIISMCRGLPLAANAVGGVLCQLDPIHWLEFSDNFLWVQGQILNQILPAIKVSYDYLPLHLKRCFAYCSLFPKGHVFCKHKLVKLWMALGFVECSRACSPEYTGRRYFNGLFERCFFQYSPSHETREERYIMHDLYHDLAEHVSDKECSRVEGYKLSSIDKQTRHSSLVSMECHSRSDIQFDSFNGQDLRSFLLFGRTEHKPDEVPFCMNVYIDLIEHCSALRVLDLSNTNIEELPHFIGILIHLRYLGLENSRIKWLPETISGLFKLQAINMKRCSNLIELPRGIKLLSNLRNLELPVNPNLWMPSGLDQLTNLQWLSLFVVGCDPTGSRIQELGSMNHLGGALVVSGLNNVSEPQHAQKANLVLKKKLQKLSLQWGSCSIQFDNFLKEKARSKVLQCLQPNPSLKELTINGFYGATFPTWLGDDCLSKLTTLKLKHCGLSNKLPSLGRLPVLKHLCILSMPKLQYVGHEFCGYSGESSTGTSESRKGFCALETLKFENMDSWQEWVGVKNTDFPNLRLLIIEKCNKLKIFPQFPSTVELRIGRCELLHMSYILDNLASNSSSVTESKCSMLTFL